MRGETWRKSTDSRITQNTRLISSATDLARRLGDVLARVRYRGSAYAVERYGVTIAHIVAPPTATAVTLGDAAAAWLANAERTDAEFARDLARVRAADRPPANPWDSSSTRAR